MIDPQPQSRISFRKKVTFTLDHTFHEKSNQKRRSNIYVKRENSTKGDKFLIIS